MVRVTIGNNLKRDNIIIDEHTTLRDALEANGIDYSKGTLALDGATLGPGDVNKTFADFGVTERCFLYSVVKADNA
jgi:hypothetical protein